MYLAHTHIPRVYAHTYTPHKHRGHAHARTRAHTHTHTHTHTHHRGERDRDRDKDRETGRKTKVRESLRDRQTRECGREEPNPAININLLRIINALFCTICFIFLAALSVPKFCKLISQLAQVIRTMSR